MSSSTWLCPPASPCTPPWFAAGCVWNKCISIYPRTQKVAALYLCWLSLKLTKPLPLLCRFPLPNFNPCLELNKANLATLPPLCTSLSLWDLLRRYFEIFKSAICNIIQSVPIRERRYLMSNSQHELRIRNWLIFVVTIWRFSGEIYCRFTVCEG